MTPVLALFVLQYTLCLTIRVPVEWNYKSEVQNNQFKDENEDPEQTFTPHDVQKKPIPKEYFEYTAKKPQFASDIAAFHGVKSPEYHFKAYPVKPHTGIKKPELGKHNIFDKGKPLFAPYRQFVNKNKHLSYVTPATSNYKIFHPYKSEEPALIAIYKDPVSEKIRNDLRDSKNRLQKYENDAGESSIEKNEYLESPQQTDRKHFSDRHVPAQFEIHRPQRRPIYYMPPITYSNRDHILNKKIRHPWSQNYAKVTPNHYRPIKNHLHTLRQNHAIKFNDENNEYPQIHSHQGYEEKPDGYDIYEEGKDKFKKLRNNVDESINDAVKKNSQSTHDKLELQSTENDNENIQDEYEFSPVKNYAQVRKFETIKHLPRDAAFKNAETYDDLRNAHRLREAIKSTKAQTVYSEEGYEDSAYDHAGEQKHASDHEGHGGYLKEKELSKGKYKIPSFNGSYEDGQGSMYRDNVLHGKKWKNHNKDDEEHKEEEDYSEDENEYYIESENSSTNKPTNEISNNQFHTTEDSLNSYNTHETDPQHDLSKREISFTVPEINIQSTFLNEDEILNISSTKLKPFKLKDLSGKYPYYNISLDEINKDSPLRYAENLKNIPRKWKGGTEFYDSRTQFECSEVEDNVDPIPEKLKKGGHPDENDNSDADNNNQKSNENNDLRNMNEKPRLKGLGDKIDCFKIKYFGENPLDSPFFEEDIIPNPEPVTAPTFKIFKLFNQLDQQLPQESQINSINLIPVIETESNNAEEYKNNNNEKISQLMGTYTELFEAPVSNDTLRNKKENINTNTNVNHTKNHRLNETNDKQFISTRKIRATPFIYEPYKIIRDSQIQDSKKTTTTSNISPLIKQLQSSRIVEKVTSFNKDQPIKRNTGSLIYKNINRKDREKSLDKTENELSNTTFVDVNEKLRVIEPRFETRPSNHKSLYTPVESKKSMSLEIYKNRTKSNNINSGRGTGNKASGRPYFDVSKYLPESLELQKPEPSNRVKHIKEISKYNPVSAQKQISMPSHSEENVESDEDYEEYDGEDVEEEITTTTTTKPNIRKRIRIVATTKRPQNKENIDEQSPKLRLITKFRNSTTNNDKSRKQKIPTPAIKENENHDDMTIPKFREKKKKSSQSTLVTDTKRYGEGNDDMRKDEVDSLIGVEHDVEEYVPQYEKEIESEDSLRENESRSSEDVREDDDVDDNDDEGDDESDDNDDDEDDDEDDVEDDDDDDDNEAGDNRTEDEKKRFDETSTTTAEPTKRTLLKTTEAPQMTTESIKSKLEIKPIISKKKIEIHQELPFSKSSPNITQFKQDFTEVEIIKEMPELSQVTPQKTAEILQMYKDGNLAKEVNNFFDVEVFKGDLNLKKGPRHGGNYRSINSSEIDDSLVPGKMVYNKNSNISKQDSESSQSETSKLTEQSYKKSKRRRGGENSESTTQPSRRSRGQNPKLGSSQAIPVKRIQSGKSKLNQYHSREAGEEKNAKLIELSEENDYNDNENADENVHGGNFETYSSSRSTGQPMHGGNYKSARITQSGEHDKEGLEPNINNRKKDTSKNFRRNSAALLNSFVHAVPILTTTPAYILDPSKRMYYYVDS